MVVEAGAAEAAAVVVEAEAAGAAEEGAVEETVPAQAQRHRFQSKRPMQAVGQQL